jgi:flagellar hook assembly protein FlgD
VNEVKGIGRYEVIWDGKDNLGRKIPEGIYFYTLETLDNKYTKKMIYTR